MNSLRRMSPPPPRAGTYHYLNHVLGVPAAMAGVDTNAGLMAKSNDNAAALGLADTVHFDTAPIGDYT